MIKNSNVYPGVIVFQIAYLLKKEFMITDNQSRLLTYIYLHNLYEESFNYTNKEIAENGFIHTLAKDTEKAVSRNLLALKINDLIVVSHMSNNIYKPRTDINATLSKEVRKKISEVEKSACKDFGVKVPKK